MTMKALLTLAALFAQHQAGLHRDTMVTGCHRAGNGITCTLTIRTRSYIDRDRLLIRRCRGRLRIWDAATTDTPAGCETSWHRTAANTDQETTA